MEFELSKALDILKTWDYPQTPRFAVLALLTNYDLLQRPVTPDDCVGTMVYVGSFKSRKEAAMHQINISSQTGFPSTIVLDLGVRRDFGIGPSRDSHVYRDDKEGVEQLMGAVTRLRERNKKIKEDIKKEDEERKNPDSVAAMTKLLYLSSSHAHHIENFERRIQESKDYLVRYEDELIAFYMRNPSIFHTWEETMKPVFAERGENHIFADLKTHFDERIRPRVEALMIQKAQGASSSEDDIGELGDEIVFAGSSHATAPTISSEQISETPASTTELLERELPAIEDGSKSQPTRAMAWRDVLVGNTTLENFKSSKPPVAAPSRGSGSEWRSRGRRHRRH